MDNGHIWQQISESAKIAIAAIPAALIPHWVLTEYDARSVLLWVVEAQSATSPTERDNKLKMAANAARRIVGRVVADNMTNYTDNVEPMVLSTATGCRGMRADVTAIVSGFGEIKCELVDAHLARQLVDRFNTHDDLVAALIGMQKAFGLLYLMATKQVKHNFALELAERGMTMHDSIARAALAKAGAA